MKNKKWMNRAWLALLLLTPVVLWILPSGFFDNTGIAVCPSVVFFNIECFGCGMTRAVMHLHHLEWEDAIYYNAGVVVVFPALVLLWFRWVIQAVRQERQTPVPSLINRRAEDE